MRRTALPLLLAPVALAAALIATAGPATSQGGASVITPGGPVKMEPVLIHDVVGGTLAGTIHTHLTVYNNGFVTVAKFHDPVLSGGGPEKDVLTAALEPAEVQQLQKDLRQAGAYALPDQPLIGTDVPLSTLTVLRGGTDAVAHTYSYLFGTGGYAAPQQVIDNLMSTHFPGF